MDFTFSETQLKKFIEMATHIILENAVSHNNKVSSEITFDEAAHLEGATGVAGLCEVVPMKTQQVKNNLFF